MRLLRSLLRPISLLVSMLWPGRKQVAPVSILMYHRVTGDVDLELDLPFATFREQMAFLVQTGRVISLDAALTGLQYGWSDNGRRYVLTFDDAYEDFYTHAWPVLKKYGLPATLYVPTAFIESPMQSPVAGDVADKERLKPASWSMLEALAASELITIGGHTHTHPELPTLDDDAIVAELKQCDAMLEERLGVRVQHFAYPRGIWNYRVRSLIEARYRSVTRVDGGAALPGKSNPRHLPRIPMQRSDGMRWFRHRVDGRLAFEEKVIAAAKRVVYKLQGY